MSERFCEKCANSTSDKKCYIGGWEDCDGLKFAPKTKLFAWTWECRGTHFTQDEGHVREMQEDGLIVTPLYKLDLD